MTGSAANPAATRRLRATAHSANPAGATLTVMELPKQGYMSVRRDILAKATVMARSVAWLFGGAFGFALLLAVTGIYGLMARSIGRRTREIGVRRALGATDRTILVMLLGEGGRQLGVGALVALPLMLVVGWGFSRFFLVTLPLAVGAALAVSTTIGAIVLAATLLPTRRAIAVPPRDALWRE